MADFQTSTHRARWFFTPDSLVGKRHIANQRAIITLEQYGCTKLEYLSNGSIVYYGQPINAREHGIEEQAYTSNALTVEEELLLQAFYGKKIQEVCGAFKFQPSVKATAIIYFKRFYLRWSIMEHHPKDIMIACIYVASKSTEYFISAKDLANCLRKEYVEALILRIEMLIYQSLEFDLIVYGPYRSIDPLISDIEKFLLEKDASEEKMKDLSICVESEIDKIMLTDAPLVFPPGQLALAALRRINKEKRVLDFERYLRNICDRQEDTVSHSEMVDCLEAIDVVMIEAKDPQRSDLARIDKKLNKCQAEKHTTEKRKRSSNETDRDKKRAKKPKRD